MGSDLTRNPGPRNRLPFLAAPTAHCRAGPFTAAEDATILQLRAAGQTWLKIAEALRRQRSSVANRGRRLGATVAPPALTDASQRHQRVRFSPAEDTFILQRRAAGNTYGEIARALQCSTSAIANLARLLAPPGAQPVAQSQAVQAAKRPRSYPLGGEVLCLGGCGRKWLSPDRMRIRICPQCKQLQSRGGSGIPEAHLTIG